MNNNDNDIPRVWAISRPINGISLNGREYMCDESGRVKLYDDISAAKNYLVVHGYSEDDIVDEGIEIVEMQDCGDHYEPITR